MCLNSKDNENLLYSWIGTLENKINDYLNNISENLTYSILPILRYKFPKEGYKSITISKSIKVTKYTSRKLLASEILDNLIRSIQVYDLEGIDINLFVLDRP
jgi:uncharacterized FlgJ-related protein